MNRLGPLHRRSVYGTGAVLIATGAAWAVTHYLPQALGIEERAAASAGVSFMKIHGAAAMLALVLFGALLPHHIRGGWKRPTNKASGIGVITITVLLGVTGYLLYYAGAEELRQAASYVHLAIGLGLPAVIVLHVFGHVRKRIARAERPANSLPHPPQASSKLDIHNHTLH